MENIVKYILPNYLSRYNKYLPREINKTIHKKLINKCLKEVTPLINFMDWIRRSNFFIPKKKSQFRALYDKCKSNELRYKIKCNALDPFKLYVYK